MLLSMCVWTPAWLVGSLLAGLVFAPFALIGAFAWLGGMLAFGVVYILFRPQNFTEQPRRFR